MRAPHWFPLQLGPIVDLNLFMQNIFFFTTYPLQFLLIFFFSNKYFRQNILSQLHDDM